MIRLWMERWCASSQKFQVVLFLQAMQISFVLTPTRAAKARWGLPRAPNPPEGRFFTPPVALFRRLPAHPPLSAPPLCVTVGVFHRHRHQPCKPSWRRLGGIYCLEGLWVDGVMRDRPIYAAQSSRGTNATLITLSRPPDVPIMFLLCRLRRRRRVVRPRGESSSLTHRVRYVLHVRGLGRVVAIDFHHVRRDLVREIVELSTPVFHTITRVSLGTTHTQEPLRARVPAPKPLSNRITRSSTLIAPLSAPPQQCL